MQPPVEAGAALAVWAAVRPAFEHLAQAAEHAPVPLALLGAYLAAHPQERGCAWAPDQDEPCRCVCPVAHPDAWSVCAGASPVGVCVTLRVPVVGSVTLPVCRACLEARTAAAPPPR